MYIRYAWDRLFIFTIILTGTLLLTGLFVPLQEVVLHTIHGINVAVLAGYYLFFFSDLRSSKNKIKYCKQHWVLILLLLVPLIPVARIARLFSIAPSLSLGQNVAWWLLDEAGVL